MDRDDTTTWRSGALTAAATIAALESLRVLFPTTYGVADAAGNAAAAAATIAVFAVPVLAPAVGRWLGPRRGVLAAAGAWAAWRIIVEVPGTVPFWLAAIGAVLGLSLFTLAVASLPAPDHGRVLGVVAGLVVDMLLMAVFVTWDPAWHRSVTTWLAAVLIASGVVATALWSRATLQPRHGGPGSGVGIGAGVALGGVLALETLFLANPAALAAASGLALGWAAAVAGAAALLVLGASLPDRLLPWPLTAGAVAVLCAVGFALPKASGPSIIAAVVLGQLAVGAIMVAAIGARPSGPTALRAGWGLSLGWVTLMLTTLLYQLHFDAPLPFDNSFVVAGAGALGALALIGGRGRSDPSAMPWRVAAWTAAPVAVLVLVAGVMSLTSPTASSGSAAGSGAPLRVVQWNVRQAVDDRGQLDPAAVADAIESQGSVDVVVLSEVARGWPLSGDVDLATWLSRDLGLPFVWGPGSGEQFGNTVLSRLPVTSVEVVELPSAGRSQGRSATSVELTLADGGSLRLIGTHLQNKNDPESKRVRMVEIERVIDLWGEQPLTVVAGDLNPEQGDPPDYPPRVPERFDEIARLLDAGLQPTTDLTTCAAPTSNDNCSDYVLVTPDLEPVDYHLVDVPGFDHRMLVTDLAIIPAD